MAPELTPQAKPEVSIYMSDQMRSNMYARGDNDPNRIPPAVFHENVAGCGGSAAAAVPV